MAAKASVKGNPGPAGPPAGTGPRLVPGEPAALMGSARAFGTWVFSRSSTGRPAVSPGWERSAACLPGAGETERRK